MNLHLAISLVVIGTITASPTPQNPYADKNICPQDPTIHFLYADPDDCTKYFSCSHGINYLMNCPGNLRFSNVYQTCVHPGSPYDTCGQTTTSQAITPSPTPTTPQTTPNPNEAKNQCPQQPTNDTYLYGDPDNCSKFFMCSNGVNVAMSCPEGLHFSDVHMTCVHRGSSFDSCEIDQAIQKCREGAASIIAHPQVCHAYFNCSNDQSQEMYSHYLPYENECSYPEVFDSATETCMSHKKAICAGISKLLKDYCDYKHHWCGGPGPCMPCKYRATSCVGLPDGLHAHSSRIDEYARCEDEYVMENLICPSGEMWNDVEKRCGPYNRRLDPYSNVAKK